MALFWRGLLCHLARPGGDPERGFFGMGGVEVARAQTIRIPRHVSVDSACLQAISGPGSRVWIAPLTVAQTGVECASLGPGASGNAQGPTHSRVGLVLMGVFRVTPVRAPTGFGGGRALSRVNGAHWHSVATLWKVFHVQFVALGGDVGKSETANLSGLMSVDSTCFRPTNWQCRITPRTVLQIGVCVSSLSKGRFVMMRSDAVERIARSLSTLRLYTSFLTLDGDLAGNQT
jgi:hypothetical protein